MAKRVMVVLHDVDRIGPVEQAIVEMAQREDTAFHLVSTDDGDALVVDEMSPRRLRLMLLLAKLSDRMVAVTGEDASLSDLSPLRDAVARHRPDTVFVAGDAAGLQQLLGRALADATPIQPLPVAA